MDAAMSAGAERNETAGITLEHIGGIVIRYDKDPALLGAAIRTAGESLRAVRKA